MFDSQLTTYAVLQRLNARGILFITLRRRGPALMRGLQGLPGAAWKRMRLHGVKPVHGRERRNKGFGQEEGSSLRLRKESFEGRILCLQRESLSWIAVGIADMNTPHAHGAGELETRDSFPGIVGKLFPRHPPPFQGGEGAGPPVGHGFHSSVCRRTGSTAWLQPVTPLGSKGISPGKTA